MKMRKQNMIATLSAVCMVTMIVDSKSAIAASTEAIELCLKTVIPSLFPFMILSSLLCKMLRGKKLPILMPIGRLMGIPTGSESLWLVGLLGGYPIGAKCINEASRDNLIPKETAQKMLAYCSNAGPSFIFGIIGGIFYNRCAVWILWLIHILSSILTAVLVSNGTKNSCNLKNTDTNLASILPGCIRSMASICVWILIFRITLNFFHRWFLWLLPAQIQIIISGVLELTNGTLMLTGLNNPGDQFIIAAGILSFGGLCILMQTVSVTDATGLGMYFPGKILQSAFSILIAYPLQLAIFPKNQQSTIPLTKILFISVSTIILISLNSRKKVVAFRNEIVYNASNT